ncbi:MAG: cation:proton antiporter [Campylobacterales bacterium]|nr:cation:proton antiporter [Campylobacterales bacterium]
MLGIIVATIFIAISSNVLLKRLNLPTIIGYIFTGTIIAYGFNLHDVANNHTLQEIAEFGIVFLMFTIGLEFSFSHLKKMRYEVFVAGSMQIGLTALVVYGISHFLLGITQTISIVLCLAIALSSTAIVLKTFNESGEINKRHGQRALGILIMQDIAVIPILLLLGFLGSHEGNVTTILLKTLINGALLLVVLYLISKFLLERFFVSITKTNSDELFVGSILFLAIGASYFAHEMGFSYSLGAFIAGMLIAETKFKHQAEADLIPFRDLLLGVFFVTVGMQIKFDIIAQYLHIVLLVLAAILTLKFIIIYGIVRLSEHKKTAFKTALALVQVGEFSLAILELARSYALIEAPYNQIMVVCIVISMVITPILLKNLTSITDKLMPTADDDAIIPDYISKGIKDHVVILGYGEFGQSVARAFREEGELYVVVERDINSYHKGLANGDPIIFGNALKKEVLKSTYYKDARRIIVAIDNPKKLFEVCEILLESVPSDKLVVKVHSYREKHALESLHIETIIVENEVTSHAALAMCTHLKEKVAYV